MQKCYTFWFSNTIRNSPLCIQNFIKSQIPTIYVWPFIHGTPIKSFLQTNFVQLFRSPDTLGTCAIVVRIAIGICKITRCSSVIFWVLCKTLLLLTLSKKRNILLHFNCYRYIWSCLLSDCFDNTWSWGNYI